ncbi:unnamed protein product [Symbiodinium natans]|uniref:Uncharacterized protein n=1 Tax=Symbiodinium natans TaxID=878477 RepID=A0A812N995_9DINO|nr:unnamed protein product [Symbiodinium natans]
MAVRRPPAQRLADKVDHLLINVEEAVVQYQAQRLKRWSENQRSVLERALKVEQAVAAKNEAITSSVVDHLRAEVSGRDVERHESAASTKKAKEDCDEAFRQELRGFAAGREKLGRTVARQQLTRLAAAFDQVMASKWQHLEEMLQRNLWHHHVEAHRASGRAGGARVEDLQQIWETGELEGHLSAEKQGWLRSQRADLDHLQVEADTELKEALKDLEQAIQASAPSRLLGAPGAGEDPEPLQQLRSVAEAARQKLEGLAAELRGRYMPKLEEAWKACEADYHRLDRELRDFHVESLQRRFKDMETLRGLKLQLCRWRLDYQDAYHKGCPDERAALDGRELQQRFHVARRLVRQLWSGGSVSAGSAHRLLAQTLKEAPSPAVASSLKVYHAELRRLGALPLVPHAKTPELLSCWLQEVNSQ